MVYSADTRRIIIFEELASSNKWMVDYYLFRRYKICFMRIHEFDRDRKWIKEMINARLLKETYQFPRLHVFEGVDYDTALDNIDHFYMVFGKNRIIKNIIRVYESNAIALVFKKMLHERLGRFYYLNHVMYNLQKIYSGRDIIFIPSPGNKLYRRTGASDIHDYKKFYRQVQEAGAAYNDTRMVRFLLWSNIVSYTYLLKRRIKTIFQVICFPAWILSVTLKNSVRIRTAIPRKKSNYQYGIMIIAPKRQFANNIQKVDFLIDGEKIRKEDVLFVSRARLATEHKKYLDNNGLRYEDGPDSYISFAEMRKVGWAYPSLLAGSLLGDYAISEEALKAAYLYLRWASFSRVVRIKKLISHSDFGIQSTARNIILAKDECETYYYMDTTNYSFCYAPADSGRKFRDNAYAFLFYDYFISWNEAASRHFMNSRCAIGKYIDAGCLWAEHIKSIEEHRMDSGFQQVLRAHGYDNEKMMLVSVFDSGYHDELIFNYGDGIAFLEDILHLLADMPHIFIIFKEKLPRDYHKKVTPRYKEILKLYKDLESHPRCYSIKRWENSSEIIAFNDLTISFPFTSSTVEAISARKKAIWHDATGKFKDTFYDSIPHIVCHDYKELSEAVDGLLKMTDEDYSRYLDAHVKGKVEKYLDGNAISRFRSVLSESAMEPLLSKQNEVVYK